MSIKSRRLVPIAVLSVISMFLLPYASARADSGAPPLSNPLFLTNPQTGNSVQIMPTTAWVAQHPQSGGSPSGSSPAPGALPSPTCTLGTDSSTGDAHVLVNSTETQFDSLDLAAFGLSSDTSNLTTQIAVQNLGDGTGVNGTPVPSTPQVAGGGDLWYTIWNYGNVPGIKGYFLQAEYPGVPTDTGYVDNASTGNLPVDFVWGTITVSPTGGEQFGPGGPATGTFDVANNRITITSPLSTVGSPPTGATLAGAHAQTEVLLGAAGTGLLETADTLTSSYSDYHVGNAGTNCPTPVAGSHGPGLPTAGVASNLGYYGGPVVHSITNHIIWWLPKAGTTTYSDGSACTIPATATYSYEQPLSGTKTVGALPGGPDGDGDYQAIITQYFKDLGGTAFYNQLTQYADEQSGNTNNSEQYGGSWTDNCGYTSTNNPTVGPTPGGTASNPIYQIDVQNEVSKAIKVNHWPDGLGNEYFVYTGYSAADCFYPPGPTPTGLTPVCNTSGVVPTYCAYHGDFQDPAGNYVLYADMADAASAANPSTLNLCYTNPIGVTDPTHNVNGKTITDPIADAEINITSHEEFETVSDSEVGTAQQLAPPLAWYDPVGGENGDKCAYNFGHYASDGSNVNLHSDHYIVQQEYSNWDNGCALTAYQGNGGYGGDKASVTIQKGLNLIGVPVSGITDTKALVTSMMASGQLPAGSITQVHVYHNGAYQTYIPGKGKAIPLSRTDGILVQSTNAGTWTPSGAVYTSPATINLQAGWNLVAATYPNPGLMTDSIFNQIEAETGACTSAILTNAACNPTITEIKTIGAGSATIDWKPSANANGQATWPQSTGNHVPFTNGMWIYSTKAITWNVQGSQCQSVDALGVCN